MNLQTFKAPTMALGLSQVKHTMGAGAVILHTRTYYERIWMGLRRREVVEITAGRGLNVPDRRRPAPAAPAVAPLRQQTLAYANATALCRGQALLETPAASNAIAAGLTKEVLAVKEMVKELFSTVRRQAT